MIGIVLSRKVSSALFVQRALAEGLVVTRTREGNVVRLLPPYIVTAAHLEEGGHKLRPTLQAL